LVIVTSGLTDNERRAAPGEQQRNSAKAFLGGFFLLGLAVAVTIATNLIVDPFGRYNLVNIRGLNALRTQAGSHPRLSKLAMVCHDRPEAVAIGTSRVAIGIDPTHPGWGAMLGHVYNLAMPGMGLEEAALTLRHAVFASRRLTLAVVGLDFMMFNANREALTPKTENVVFDPQRFVLSETDSCFASFLHDFDLWLGPKGLVQSVATVLRQMPEAERKDPNKIVIWLSLVRRDGLMDNAKVFEDRARTGGYRALFGPGGQERYYASVVWLPPPDRNYCFSRDGLNTFETFRDMVRFARQAGIDLRFFIDPLHARMLLAMQYVGLWPVYEEWKRRLVQILAEESSESGKPMFPLWDFSGFNTVTTESVPPEGDLKTPVKWFWEPSHYKKETGDLILDRILNYQPSSALLPDDFGILLTPTNIETTLAADSKKGEEYLRRESDDAALVRSVTNEATKNVRPLACQASPGK
jgi:hypothetical protein